MGQCLRLAVARAGVVAVAAAVAGAVASAAPAAADVTLTPTQATQDDAARLTFRVTTERGSAPTTRVQVALPEASPVAEVYPLSNADWAPVLTQKHLDKPIEAIHGTQTSDVVTMVTWTARAGWQLEPGESSALDVELGPMPETDRLVFTVTQTHADGSVTHPKLVLNLAPPPAGQAEGPGHGAHAGAASDAGAAEDSSVQDSGEGSGGTRLALIISVLVVGLAGGAALGGFALPRLRRGAAGLTISADALDVPADPGRADPRLAR